MAGNPEFLDPKNICCKDKLDLIRMCDKALQIHLKNMKFWKTVFEEGFLEVPESQLCLVERLKHEFIENYKFLDYTATSLSEQRRIITQHVSSVASPIYLDDQKPLSDSVEHQEKSNSVVNVQDTQQEVLIDGV